MPCCHRPPFGAALFYACVPPVATGQATDARQSLGETMKKATKAVLLSALVYPGTGQLYLKKYLLAAVLFAIATVALYVLLEPVVVMANEMAGKLVSGELQAGPDLIADVMATSRQMSDGQTMSVASLVLLGTWLVGIVHAWRAGS